MAKFFNPITGEDITTLEVRRTTKFRIGLEGNGPSPDFKRMNVTTCTNAAPDGQLNESDPAVRLAQNPPKEAGKFIYEIDPAKMQGHRIRACVNGADYSEPVVITLKSEAEIRKSIVDLARSFVGDAHYLWGTAGNEPGKGNGNAGGGGKQMAARMRDYSLDPNETAQQKVLAVATAVCVIGGYSTCAGRSTLCEKNYGPFPDDSGLNSFLKNCQDAIASGKTDQTMWDGAGPKKNLFPRKYYWQGALQNSGTAVWGESCNGVRHFDCVGLVNYCYGKHWYRTNFGLDISAFRNSNQGTREVGDNKDLMDADILLKSGNHHIAMLYNSGNDWFVVQAYGTAVGLTDDERFNPSLWDRYRMHAAYLVGKHS